MSGEKKVFTVTELNRMVYGLLEAGFPSVWLEGEISNYKLYPSGHAYFTLKDSESQISSVIFRRERSLFKFTPEDGMKVIVHGRISVYTKRGEYQVIIDSLDPAGKGALQVAFEQLKSKLEKEGLFDTGRKRQIPFLPQKIGIVTSPKGAAIRDILTVINRRFTNIEILLYPVAVQGDEAAPQIAQAIMDLNEQFPELDVLLVGRGGGSIEDLWAFNEEIVARAIAGSKIPVISCVGHEIDYTIADFVADLRAPTPSAAAELVVRDKKELVEQVQRLWSRLKIGLDYKMNDYTQRVNRVYKTKIFMFPNRLYEVFDQQLDHLKEKLYRQINYSYELQEKHFRMVTEKLDLLSPLAVLGRGYSIAFKLPGNEILRDANKVKSDDKIKIKLGKGEIFCTVDKV